MSAPTPTSARGTGAKARGARAPASGRLLLRMHPGLHRDLARAAEEAGKSLNQFITDTLDAALAAGSGRPAGPGTAPRRASRLVTAVLVANVVVVAVAAIAAVVLIALALRS